MAGTVIRRADLDDVTVVLSLFDGAVAWMNAHGNTEQWGTARWSDVPERREMVERWCRAPGSWVALTPAGRVGGFLVVGSAHAYVPPSSRPGPELYVEALVASRAENERGYGRRLLAHADELAARAGIRELRVDCFAGRGGDLVRFYESAGYVKDVTFRVKEWPGQVLTRTLATEDD
ncbi:GNAT family N-acetyltransferase [Microbacterium sp. NPDC058345]|uniref:GNAT family N-acetyltransferase n=1 Tax=Microbacterium sp. NPDC058345 TaxID=3346455 RepID=UPI00366780E0